MNSDFTSKEIPDGQVFLLTRWANYGSNPATTTGASIRSAAHAHRLKTKTNMVDKMNIFVDTLRNALDNPEAELRGRGIDQKSINDAFEELRILAVPVSKHYLSRGQIFKLKLSYIKLFDITAF